VEKVKNLCYFCKKEKEKTPFLFCRTCEKKILARLRYYKKLIFPAQPGFGFPWIMINCWNEELKTETQEKQYFLNMPKKESDWRRMERFAILQHAFNCTSPRPEECKTMEKLKELLGEGTLWAVIKAKYLEREEEEEDEEKI
jgi:hypothetical protein